MVIKVFKFLWWSQFEKPPLKYMADYFHDWKRVDIRDIYLKISQMSNWVGWIAHLRNFRITRNWVLFLKIFHFRSSLKHPYNTLETLQWLSKSYNEIYLKISQMSNWVGWIAHLRNFQITRNWVIFLKFFHFRSSLKHPYNTFETLSWLSKSYKNIYLKISQMSNWVGWIAHLRNFRITRNWDIYFENFSFQIAFKTPI